MPPFLKQETMKTLWDPVIKTSKDSKHFWGLGWAVSEQAQDFAFAEKHRFYSVHTGKFVSTVKYSDLHFVSSQHAC